MNTNSTQIYAQQVRNYIDTEDGYQVLRKHLLKDIQQNNGEHQEADDQLLPTIIESLIYGLETESAQKVSRTLDIIEDLVQNAESQVTSELNTKSFSQALCQCAIAKHIVTFHKDTWLINNQRIYGLFQLWFQLYAQRESQCYWLVKGYKELSEQEPKLSQHSFVNLKVNKQQKQSTAPSQDLDTHSKHSLSATFDSINEYVAYAEEEYRKDPLKCTTTEFVRALKVKAKCLFDLSQDKTIQLTKSEMELTKDMYKRVRKMLKQLEKANEQRIKQKKIKEEEKFFEAKIDAISPKKTVKAQTIDLLSDESNVPTNNESPKQQINNQLVEIQPTLENSIKKPKIITPVKVKQEDLLDLQEVPNSTQDKVVKETLSSLLDLEEYQTVRGSNEQRSPQKVVDEEKKIISDNLLDLAEPEAQVHQILEGLKNSRTNKENGEIENEEQLWKEVELAHTPSKSSAKDFIQDSEIGSSGKLGKSESMMSPDRDILVSPSKSNLSLNSSTQM